MFNYIKLKKDESSYLIVPLSQLEKQKIKTYLIFYS